MLPPNKPQRREFLQQAVAATTIWKLLPDSLQADEQSGQPLQLATFQFDVTPPLGHSLCGGWIKPVEGVTDNLQAIGFVLLGAGKPIVIVAVDWTGILNEAHIQWRTVLANAAVCITEACGSAVFILTTCPGLPCGSMRASKT